MTTAVGEAGDGALKLDVVFEAVEDGWGGGELSGASGGATARGGRGTRRWRISGRPLKAIWASTVPQFNAASAACQV